MDHKAAGTGLERICQSLTVGQASQELTVFAETRDEKPITLSNW
jgi:hypothetical protein